MLKTTLLHPQILHALGRAGHGSKVLIADGNFPAATSRGPNAEFVSLNLMPGLVNGTQALEAIASAIPIEAAAVMETLKTGPYAMKKDPPIWAKYHRIIKATGSDLDFERIERFAFYDAARAPEVALLVVTAEQSPYANLLLTIGVVKPR